MEKNSLLFYKSLLPFLTFLNCEGAYLADGFLQTLAHILIFICTIRSHGKSKVCWNSDCCRAQLNYKFIQKKESQKWSIRTYLPVKLADGRMSTEKEKLSSYLICNIVHLSKMAGKTEPISGKISWKFSHWKNLLIFHTQERALRQIFSCS